VRGAPTGWKIANLANVGLWPPVHVLRAAAARDGLQKVDERQCLVGAKHLRKKKEQEQEQVSPILALRD
jgi:hypothetical protein